MISQSRNTPVQNKRDQAQQLYSPLDSWSMQRTSIITVMKEASGHIVRDNTKVTAHDHALQSSRAWSWHTFYMPAFGNEVQNVRRGSCGIRLPVGPGWIDGRSKLRGWVKDLMNVLDSKAIDSSEGLGKMLPLTIRGDR
jgi:hypothetical protein